MGGEASSGDGDKQNAQKAEYMPIVLLGLPKQYQAAANRLIDTSTRDEVFFGSPLPLLSLLPHSVELALKAFLGVGSHLGWV